MRRPDRRANRPGGGLRSQVGSSSPVVLAIVMLIAFAFVLVNLIVDVIYTLIDPRVHR